MILVIDGKEHEVILEKDTPLFYEIRGVSGNGVGVIHKETGKGRYRPNTNSINKGVHGKVFFLSKKDLALIKGGKM